MGDRRGDITDTFFKIGQKRVHQLKRLVSFFLAFIGELDARLDAPEQIWGNGDIAVCGEPVAQIAHNLVYAENFLKH
jgi:hypothetical protein